MGKLNEKLATENKKVNAELLLKQDELYIKENWLIFAIIYAIYSILADILFTSFFQRENPPLGSVILGNVIFLCLIYHFAYRKAGTRFLTFIGFIKLFGLIEMIQLTTITPIQGSIVLNYCFTVVDFFFVVGWLFLSFRLRKLNLTAKDFRKNIVVSSGV